MDKDKREELLRYDACAQSQLSSFGGASTEHKFGSSAMPHYLRTPYVFYEKCVSELISSKDQILELAAGSGLHTWTLVNTGAQVMATDISPNSLKLLTKNIMNAGGDVKTQVADMESLPFADNSFDAVACAGSLSYGNPVQVDAEIRRVLRPGGVLVCVDSLNHNPIYRLNRWIHYLRDERTKSTIRRTPDLTRIDTLSNSFSRVEVNYFGALSFLMPLISWLCGTIRAQVVLDYFDRLIGAKRSAFKFVMVAKGLTKTVISKSL